MTEVLAATRPETAPRRAATRLERAVNAALVNIGFREPGLARAGGISVICKADEAFAIRAAAARAAGRSLDLQYYVWRGDLTGQLLGREVLAAADRGVRVRMLLDDAFAIGRERVLAILDAHPMIEIRLFNATRWRRFGRAGMWLEFAFGGWHLNRRMHNKNWIADGRFAVVGGRNIGNEYFGLDEAGAICFRDLDLALAGAPAAGAVAVFERYWNSPLARPSAELSAVAPRHGIVALRKEHDETAAKPEARRLLASLTEHPARRIRRGLTPVAEGAVRVQADAPEKAKRGLGARKRARAAGGIAAEIADEIRTAKRELRLISPYFVPGKAGLALLLDLISRGVHVSVVTNALASTDVVAVHGGYMRYRRPLLRAGVAIHELKPGPVGEAASLFGSRGGAALHTKAFVVDGLRAFVGSFNLDPRSAMLNTEMGAFVQNPVVAKEVAEEQERLMDPAISWKVEIEGGRVVWRDVVEGETRTLHTEPRASWRRTLVAWAARVLPVEEQL